MPITLEQHEKKLQDPAVCELLPVRDYLDGVMVRTNGALVAGYELRGINSYFASDGERDQNKGMLGALLKSIPEQSMTMQIRYEVVEDLGNLLGNYVAQDRLDQEAVCALDATRLEAWGKKAESGHYLRPLLHIYFIWDPRIHHRVTGKGQKQAINFSVSALSSKAAIQRSRQEHERLLAEFESLLSGMETTMQAANLGARRLNDDELFLEAKRALNPLAPERKSHIAGENFLEYRSAREQLADVSILNEAESHINIDGLLYSLVSLKELPDATFSGILRELAALDFPIVVSAQVTIPDQAKVLKAYKSRFKKMQAAQRDTHGSFRTNVEAQVAESQLFRVQQDIIASSLKTAKLSLVIATRTSKPPTTGGEYEEAERLISNRRQQLLYAIARMNGAKAITETLAKRRLFFSILPGMAEADRREHDMLSPNAVDLLPVETPWAGTPRSPLFLLETPYRQLIPFSPFDPSLSDANMLIMGKSGGGKTLMMQMLLSMSARVDPLVSIIERGDSYQPLVELMGGQMISMSLDSDQTINAWDLPKGEREPSKDQVAFLRNLTRHMMGEGGAEDTDLLDNLLTEAILRTYKRAAIRPSNPIPTFSDLRDELAQWRDEDKNQRVMDEAHLAAIKLRSWTGEKGPYSRLFDRPTTISLDSAWLFFNVEKLADDPRLEGAMSLVIARAMSLRASGKSGRLAIVVMDEFWFILDSPVLAPEAVQLFRTARKRGVIVCGISQTAEDYVGTKEKPRLHGPGIIKNASTKIVGQQPGDITPLREHFHLSDTAINTIKQFSAPRKGHHADALIVIGEKAETTHAVRMVPTPIEYWIMSTYARERHYRGWWLREHLDLPLIEAYRALAEKFPQGLAEIDPLPEEISGEVAKGAQQ
jgi:type IV secretory pathway VirB4 component